MAPNAAGTLVVLIGPPAVGKMTVGRALEARTGLPLFHNHMTIEMVLPFFDFGTPEYGRLVGGFRRDLLDEVARSDLPGVIFTYVWAFDLPGDRTFMDEIVGLFARRGGRAVFAELWADQETRLTRDRNPDRLAAKPSKRDAARSREFIVTVDERFRLTSDGDFPYPDHLRLDVTDLPPEDAAARIADHFGLAAADGG